MSKADLPNIGLAVSCLSGEIMLARVGKNPRLALERRAVTTEALGVVTEYMMAGSPRGASVDVWLDGKKHTLTVVPCRKARDRKEFLPESEAV